MSPADRDRAIARADALIEQASALLPIVRSVLATQPHPLSAFAEKGFTLADFVDWRLALPSRTRRLEAAARILSVADATFATPTPAPAASPD